MKNILIFILSFSMLPLLAQESLNLPIKEKTRQELMFGIRPGFNMGGVGSHLKNSMRLSGMSAANVGIFNMDYPRATLSGSFMLVAEYRQNRYGFGLEYGLSDIGSTTGIAKTYKDTFFVWETTMRDYIVVEHKVTNLSPYFRYYGKHLGLQAGISRNNWSLKTHNNYSVKKTTYGGHLGMFVTVFDGKNLRMEFTSLYRIVGKHPIGPISFYDEKLDKYVEKFQKRDVSLNHLQFGFTMLLKFPGVH